MRSRSAPRRGRTRRCWSRAGTRRTRTRRRSGWRYYATAVPPRRGRRDLLRAAGRADRGAVGAAHAAGVHVQHQGVQPAHRAPDQGLRDLQGPAAGDRQEERLPGRPAGAGVRGGLDAVPVRARTRWCEAGKLGAVLFQFPPWFTIRQVQQGVPARGAKRCEPLRAVYRVPERVLVRGRQPRRDPGVPAPPPAAVRQRRHAAGPQVVHPAGPRGHRRPGRGAVPRPQRQVDQQGHLREVRLPSTPSGSWPTGRRGCSSWPTRPPRRTCS